MSTFWGVIKEYRGEVEKYINKEDIDIVATILRDEGEIGEELGKYGPCRINDEHNKMYEECMEVYEKSVDYLSGVVANVNEYDFDLLLEILLAVQSYYRPVNMLLLNNSRYEITYASIICEIQKDLVKIKNGEDSDLSWIKKMCVPVTTSCCLRCKKKIKKI